VTSAYVHFPYCLQKCPYCDFVSYATKADEIDHKGYADAVLRELEARPRVEPQTTFFGGGTPSLWDARELGRVLAALGGDEITVECNPSSLDEERAAKLKDVGVNRLSIGTQALKSEQLRFLGRLHDKDGAIRAIEGAIRSGMPRVSTDMIFGLPEQTPEDAREQALALADLGVGHLSCYQLTIEPNTRFGELAKRGRLPLADDGLVAESFLAIDEALRARGFVHYEISNYAKPGEEARHNLAYWNGDEYLGLGCGAYGCVGGVRYRNEIVPAKYLEKCAAPTIEEEPLDAETRLRERIMLGLRLRDGFDLEAAARELGVDPWPANRKREAERLVEMGRLCIDAGRLSIPTRAWLWADDTAARLF
jgi:oxygen-independent coproporphyrinogen-3 oxidase